MDHLIPSRVYPAGITDFGPFVISAGSRLQVRLLRENWPDSGGMEIISVELLMSIDNGQSWLGAFGINPTFGFGAAGGVLPKDKFGQPVPESQVTWPITSPCILKGRLKLQQPLRTTVTLTLT